LCEQIFSIHSSTTHATLLETFFAILVVQLAFLRIGEDFVGFG
jgi:hypothetical protein